MSKVRGLAKFERVFSFFGVGLELQVNKIKNDIQESSMDSFI